MSLYNEMKEKAYHDRVTLEDVFRSGAENCMKHNGFRLNDYGNHDRAE